MRRYFKICLFLVGTVLFQSVSAQETWDLERCINYALENNLNVQKQLLEIDDAELQIKRTKDAFLPELGAGLGGQMNFGRTLDQDNQYQNYNSNTSNVNLRASWSLFEGFRRQRDKELAHLNLAFYELTLEQINNDISLSIATSYLDVLQNKELLTVLKSQLNTSQEDGRQIKIRYDAGDVSRDVYLEIQAQIAREQSRVVESESSLSNALLILAQILDLQDITNFDVIVPELPLLESKVSLVSAAEIFESALSLPQIKGAELVIESNMVAIERAKSGFYPSASLGGNYYTSYNSNNSSSFSDQLSENQRQSLGINISIPIFSKFQNKNAVKAAIIQMEKSELDLEIEKKGLRQQIQSAYANAKSSYAKFISAEEALRATRESNRFSMEKYQVGAISPFDYNTSKGQLLQAEAELLQAKYSFIFATKVLEFYNGIPLAL